MGPSADDEGDGHGNNIIMKTLEEYCSSIPGWIGPDIFLAPEAAIYFGVLVVVGYVILRSTVPLFYETLVAACSVLVEKCGLGKAAVMMLDKVVLESLKLYHRMPNEMKELVVMGLREKMPCMPDIGHPGAPASPPDAKANSKPRLVL